MSRHWTIGGPSEPEEDRTQAEVRPWQSGVASPPVVRTPQFMLGGRLAAVREPRFMRRILPRVVDPILEPDPFVKTLENKSHGK